MKGSVATHMYVTGQRVSLLCCFPNHLKQMVAKRKCKGSVHFFYQSLYVESINNSLLFIIQA